MHKTLQKLADTFGSDCAFDNHKVHFAARSNGCNHIQSEAGSRGLNNRCLTFQRPRGSGMKVRTHSRFILQDNFGAFFFGSLFKFWIDLFFLLFNNLRVSLVCAIK
jgi:hypothetical protein